MSIGREKTSLEASQASQTPARRRRLARPLRAEDGVVRGEVRVDRPLRPAHLARARDAVVVGRGRRRRLVHAPVALRLGHRLLRPGARHQVVGRRAVGQQVRGQHEELASRRRPRGTARRSRRECRRARGSRPRSAATTFSKGPPRWLCSRMPMPVPSKSQSAACASRSTSSGSTAGPAEKLKMRCSSGHRRLGLAARTPIAAVADSSPRCATFRGCEVETRSGRLRGAERARRARVPRHPLRGAAGRPRCASARPSRPRPGPACATRRALGPRRAAARLDARRRLHAHRGRRRDLGGLPHARRLDARRRRRAPPGAGVAPRRRLRDGRGQRARLRRRSGSRGAATSWW